MGQDQSSVFDLAAVAAASNGGNNDPLLPPARYIGAPQKPSKMPYNKYVAYDKQVPFDFPERTWPGKRLQRAPRWCSVDLRDGNQVSSTRWIPSASWFLEPARVDGLRGRSRSVFRRLPKTDYDFIRMLIERELIPDDVTIVVLTQAREHLIFARLTEPQPWRGAKRAVVHFTMSPCCSARSCSARQGRHQEARHRRGHWLLRARGRSQGHRPVLRVFSGILHRHRAGVRSRGVQRAVIDVVSRRRNIR